MNKEKKIGEKNNYSGWQMFSLTLLRVLIGWHFLYEGLIKVYEGHYLMASITT